MPEKMLKEYYKNYNEIIKDKCKEKNCILKGNYHEYIVLDGDEIDKSINNNLTKSADCIIISKNADYNNNVNIMLCELCKSTKKYNDVKNKMINSGNHIVSVFNNSQFGINEFKCCYLGKYENSNKIKQIKTKPIHIQGLNRNNIIINNYPCGTSINKLINN